MPPYPKTLFSCDEIVAACEKAKADGDTSYATVFSITLGGRASPSAHYFDLNCCAGGKEGKLFMNFRRETFVGRILPLTPSEGSYARDPTRAPSLGVQRFPGLKEGEAPDREAPQSSFFLAVQCLDAFLQAEANRLLDDGTLYTKAPSGGPKPGSVKIKNSSVVRLFQDTVSLKSRSNPGMPLTNPIARMVLRFTEDGEPRKDTEYWEVLDAEDPRAKLGPLAPLRFDDVPLCAANVHKLQPGSAISGILDLSAVCCSSMGISVPSCVRCLCVKPAEEQKWDAKAILGDLL